MLLISPTAPKYPRISAPDALTVAGYESIYSISQSDVKLSGPVNCPRLTSTFSRYAPTSIDDDVPHLEMGQVFRLTTMLSGHMAAFVLYAALATATTASTVQATNEACQCTFGTLPVPVDIEIPAHPENGLTTTDLRRLKAVYDIFGVFCQPKESFGNSGSRQLYLFISPNSQ